MQLWFYKAERGNYFDKFLGLWTGGSYSHVEVCFQGGECFSSSPRDSGVRYKKIEWTDNWDIVNIGLFTFEERLHQIGDKQVGKHYDWLGAVGMGLNFGPLEDKNKWYCSELISFMLNRINLINCPTEISPNTLYELCRQKFSA